MSEVIKQVRLGTNDYDFQSVKPMNQDQSKQSEPKRGLVQIRSRIDGNIYTAKLFKVLNKNGSIILSTESVTEV